MTTTLIAALAVALACLVSAAVGENPVAAAERVIVDDLGFTVKLSHRIRRIVSLVPTNSEMVCLLDCRRLVGGTRYDYAPEELMQRREKKQIAVIGGGYDANLERIVKLTPDLILTNGPTQQRFALPLKKLGYPVVSLWPRDFKGLRRTVTLLGTLMGESAKGQALLKEIEQQFNAITVKAERAERKKVYLQMWTEPLITVGKASFPDWLVGAAGGINVFHDLPIDSGEVSLESIIARDPQVLIFLADQKPFARSLAQRPGWSVIRGVREQRFCFIDEADINRSVNFIAGLSRIQRCLGDGDINR